MDAKDWRNRQTIKGTILLIRAKLLIAEPNEVIYHFLKTHFTSLSVYGEYYQIERADTAEQIHRKGLLFGPDVCLVNSSLMQEYYKNMSMYLPETESVNLRIITYDTEKAGNLTDQELERVAKEVKMTCLKYGFLTVKWTEI
ncbi:MAG: hypothetical protein V2A72_06970 [Candidatus Omnitrophota bacterium]